ncbi:MAG TPA: peroxidase family protein [Thermoleophilaceae bacterium]|nr:peroxidase family protein [Thermoleophilaceae bacterium]
MTAATGIREVSIGGDHCLAPSRVVDAPVDGVAGRYERLFPELAPLEGDDEALLALGAAGGICDGGESGDDAVETAAGWPLFGQFIAHDITADRSPLAHGAELSDAVNFRSPRANLECLYGSGPIGSPFLYRRDDPAVLLLGRNDRGEEADLPRNSEGIALVGDPRNDVHLFVSQLHVAMIGAHNRLAVRKRERGTPAGEVFEAARRETAWHYQWVIVNDYLPRLVGSELVDSILERGPRFYRPEGEPRIPLEFADAAFRYGHSQVRDSFELNSRSGVRRLFPDLMGFQRVPAGLAIEWSRIFDVDGEPPAQRAKLIDGRLARSLIELPAEITGEVEVDAYHSLAGRDLERGHAYGLPSGEAVAAAMGEAPLDDDPLGLRAAGWQGDTPLWLYFLAESASRGAGERLGPAGGRIVAEVLLGIIDADPGSYRAGDPGWTPTLPARGQRFGLTDLLVPA